jgi:ABC-2 type transport system permease protein
MSAVRAVLATMRAAAAESWANRQVFGVQVTVMVVNDLAWVGFWLLFFDRVGTVRGWDADRVLLLFAMLTTSAGLVLGFLANARSVGRLAADGELDAVLVRRIETTNLGDFVFGIVLFAVAGTPTLERTALYVAGTLAGAVLLTGFLVATGSLAFFGGRGETGEFGLHAMLLLASYPADIFTGASKAVLYTAVPAAFVAAVPSTLVDDFDATTALVLAAAAAFFATAGWTLFTLGLRRYTSGSLWTRA